MKLVEKISASCTLLLLLALSGCEEPVYKVYTGNAPVYMSYAELRSSVAFDNSVVLEKPGKTYFTDDYIFIIEDFKGIHVYDNSNPSSPVKKSFIRLPGVSDISVSDNFLYADSYTDLVVFDIEDIDNIKMAGRRESMFQYILPPANNSLPKARCDKSKGVVVGWQVEKIREKEGGYDYYIEVLDAKTFIEKSNPAGASSGKNGDGTGAGGPLARFLIWGNSMLVIDQFYALVYQVSDLLSPYSSPSEFDAWSVKTISVSGDNLFLGTDYSSYIAYLSVPLSGQMTSYFGQVSYCNPVIAVDTLVFLTTRTGTSCGDYPNMLRVVGTGNIIDPHVLNSYPMSNPLGLAIDGSLLFVCDGTDGLLIFDTSDPLTLNEHLIKTCPGIKGHNAFIVNDVLVILSRDGIFQYDYSDIQNITLLSSIIPGQ